jgi:hypothetical protein
MTYRNAPRNIFTFPGSVSIFSRLNVVTVKKYVPPFVRARRYRIVVKYMQGWVSFLNPTLYYSIQIFEIFFNVNFFDYQRVLQRSGLCLIKTNSYDEMAFQVNHLILL